MNRLIIGFLIMTSLTCFGQTSSDSYDTFFMEALVQREKGNNDAAFDLLRHCQELRPDAAEVYYLLGQYYNALKNQEQSIACVKRAAELAPDNPTYLETLAHTYISQQDYQAAIPVVERIYENDKNRLEMLEMLYRLYQSTNNYDEAIRVLNQLEQIDGKSEAISTAKSNIYTLMGNGDAAVSEIEALAQQYPNDLNFMALYGETLMMNDRTQEALDTYHKILGQEPNNTRVLMSLRTYYQAEAQQTEVDSLTERILLSPEATTDDRVALLRQEIAQSEEAGGDSTRVIQLFERLLVLPDADPDMGILYASYMTHKQMPNDSIKRVYEYVLAHHPDQAMARLRLVGYAWEQDDMQHVINLCQEARQYNPDEMAFYYYQGIAYYREEQLDNALSAFQNGIGVITPESNPDIVSDFYAVMGDIYHQKGLADKAFAAYDSCLVWKSDNIGCLNNYAYYLSLEGKQLNRAEQMSYNTIKAEPKSATYLDTYAWILFMQQRYAEAKVYIEQALQNLDEEQDNSVLYEHAGDINILLNNSQQAIDYWTLALQKRPDDKTLKQKIKRKKYIKE